MLPADIHLFEGGRVRSVTIGDHLLEMPVLGLADVVGGLTLVLVVAWPTELLTCHRFHQLTAFFTSFAILVSSVSVSFSSAVGDRPSAHRRASPSR